MWVLGFFCVYFSTTCILRCLNGFFFHPLMLRCITEWNLKRKVRWNDVERAKVVGNVQHNWINSWIAMRWRSTAALNMELRMYFLFFFLALLRPVSYTHHTFVYFSSFPPVVISRSEERERKRKERWHVEWKNRIRGGFRAINIVAGGESTATAGF